MSCIVVFNRIVQTVRENCCLCAGSNTSSPSVSLAVSQRMLLVKFSVGYNVNMLNQGPGNATPHECMED